MPVWLLSIVANLIVKFGLPYVMLWLRKRFPSIPGETIEPVLQELVGNLRENRQAKRAAIRKAKNKVRECVGAQCST